MSKVKFFNAINLNNCCFSSANATPDFEGRGGEDLAEAISNTLTSAYRSSFSFDSRKLCILAGRKCWKVYVDVLVSKANLPNFNNSKF